MDREKPFKIAGFFLSRIVHLSISRKIFLTSHFPVSQGRLLYNKKGSAGSSQGLDECFDSTLHGGEPGHLLHSPRNSEK